MYYEYLMTNDNDNQYYVRGLTKSADSLHERFLSVWSTTHGPTRINAQV